MKKLCLHLQNMNSLSKQIIRYCVLIWCAYTVSYLFLLHTYHCKNTIQLLLARCIEAYPLLCLMSLSLCISAAALIDIYVKTQISKE